MLTPAKKK